MRGRTTATGARAGKDTGSPRTNAITPLQPAPSLRTAPAERLLQRSYRNLTRKHLGRLLVKLFAGFTGLHFHIAWAPTTSRKWETRTLPTACSVCCRIAGTRLATQPVCRVCGPKQLARALGADGTGLSFKCRLGVFNYWLPIRVRGVTIGIANLQALDVVGAGRARHRHPGRATALVTTHARFNQACELLRLIIQHVQTLDLAELRKVELTNAGRAVAALEKEQARLHEVLQRHLPAASETSRRAAPESHPEQIVNHLLECIEQNYGKFITLQNCACQLGINAAYASALFSRAVGVPFKTHLTERRMEKAKELLGDPANSASDVAAAVGYASENRFRLAFKKATGLSPKSWRETMQTNAPPPPR